MAQSSQQDLFGTNSQAECFSSTRPLRPTGLIRTRFGRGSRRISDPEARAAEKLPWDADRLLVYRTIFPQMAGWLPEEEGAQLKFEFNTPKWHASRRHNLSPLHHVLPLLARAFGE